MHFGYYRDCQIKMMNINRMLVGPLESCCYIINTEISKTAMIIDPGGDADLIAAYCKNNNLIPIMIINTHGHGDHIGANKGLKELYPDIKIYIHCDDAAMLTNEYLNLSLLGGKRYKSPPADHVLRDNDTILFDNIKFKVLHVPGHTKGGICLLCDSTYKLDNDLNGIDNRQNDYVLFSGDSLFSGGIGRTDLPNSNFETLVDAIKNRILTLEDNTIVFPGHGDTTTILNERENNPFISVQNV